MICVKFTTFCGLRADLRIRLASGLKEAVWVLMLCAPVFIFTSSSSALLGRPRCGLSIWLFLLAILNTLFWVYASFLHEKTDKTREYSKYENGHRPLQGAQSINTGRPYVGGLAGSPCCSYDFSRSLYRWFSCSSCQMRASFAFSCVFKKLISSFWSTYARRN